MPLKDALKIALKGLQANKSRSFLTILGIVIGITAIIMVMSIGNGAQSLILNQIQGLGSQTIIIEPGKEPTGPSSYAEIFTDSLKERDIKALLNPANVPNLKELTPNVVQVANITYGSESIRESVIGCSDAITRILDIYPDEGTVFGADEIASKASVAILGAEVKKKLFGASDALGEKIKIKGRTFRVVGILAAKGQVSLFNVDNMVLVPYTTAQQYLLGIDYFHTFILRASSDETVDQVVRDAQATLREMHGIDDPSKDDFHVTSQADAAERVRTITDVLTMLLISVAAISLVVGGIGIMNIMLVSVTERTREIGLRKAIGATENDILLQFLLEAVILTAMGGVFGIILGAGLSFLISIILTNAVGLDWTFVFPVSAAVLGISVSAVIGLVFGLYPARQASQKSPIEALRYE